jgi:hypothetical protein
MIISEEMTALMAVVQALDALGVPYALGGSLASAVHGVVRATLDADLIADLRPNHADPLARALAGAFYADEVAIDEAIRARGSFNIIHLDTLFKIDVFVAGPRPFDRAQLARSRLHLLSEEPECTVRVLSAEDTLLAKLEWYRRGGQVSDRQWRDVLGVLKVQGERLDDEYLRRMAIELDVAGLLARALEKVR